MAGRLADAEADLRAPREPGADERPWRIRSTPLMTSFLILCLLERGDLDGAVAVLDAVDLDEALQPIIAHAPFLYARAQVRIARGDPHAALEDLRACGARLEAGGWRHPGVAPWRGAAARVLMQLDDDREAARLAAEELALAEAVGAPRSLARALRDRAATTSAPQARLLLERAVAAGRDAPGEIEEASARLELGALLVHDAPADARRELTAALGLARAAGAEPLARRAAGLLRAAGGRPRRADPSGLGVLTPSERRVAELAADGHTNREIAEQLVVTTKTVETHLRAVYRKLAIGSRAELPEAMRAIAPDRGSSTSA
jgi:DNA-binding NarL/FixJ family response regulator